jgi:hypothetical protein
MAIGGARSRERGNKELGQSTTCILVGSTACAPGQLFHRALTSINARTIVAA